MSTLLINNRRYNCEPWELMNWDKLHAILRYDEQRRRSDRQSVDRLTAELLTKIAGVRRSLARRTDPDDRILVAECSSRIFPASCDGSKTGRPTRRETSVKKRIGTITACRPRTKRIGREARYRCPG